MKENFEKRVKQVLQIVKRELIKTSVGTYLTRGIVNQLSERDKLDLRVGLSDLLSFLICISLLDALYDSLFHSSI
jgi:hypothetical protein